MSSQTTPSPPHAAAVISDDEKLTPPSPQKPDLLSEPRPVPPPRTPVFPSREDCWSEEATRTLIDAWGSHYLDLNRGNLRQKHWQEVADAVNSVHAGASAKLRRSDIQCKNRIDTAKKKFKVEKSKIVKSHGRYVSTWPHFESLDALIGDSFYKTPNSTSTKNLCRRTSPSEIAIGHRNSSPEILRREKDRSARHPLSLTWSVPVGPRSKRSGPGSVTERNFSVMAAAAAAMEAEEDVEGCGVQTVGRKRKAADEGYRMLAEAIMRVGEIYEKVEVAKQRQMVEFEKQRMQFAKDLEILRSQVQLDSLKCSFKNNSYL